MKPVTRQKERGGYVIIFVALTMALIMGALGFSIDAAVLYTVRAKLSAACDAASLAAARNLNVGMTMVEQEASARARATSFYNANFPASYLGSTRNPPVVNIPTGGTASVLTVTTSGSAVAPTFFMRYFGMNSINLSASGTASRRDVNVMLVLDRSSSMTANDPGKIMPQKAKDFVMQFVEDRDQVGLAVFGTDVAITKPNLRFKTDLSNEIDKIKYGNNTNITTAYIKAYEELWALNEPSALNVILLFTDGNPNGVYATFKTDKGSKCNGGSVTGLLTRGWPPNAPMEGEIHGLYKWQATSVSTMGANRIDGASDCNFKKTGTLKIVDDINGIPNEDYWGNRSRGYPNQYERTQDYLNENGLIKANSPWVQFLAGKNQLDHAAMRIRARYLGPNVGVVTYVIGLSKSPEVNERPDDVLMRRVANDPAGRDDPNSVYQHDLEVPDGMYIRADDVNQMAEAFQKIASEVLRLSR